MVGQFPLFDSHTLNGQTTVEDAIDATHAEQRAEIERAAAAVKAEEEQAARDAEGIRAMISADLPAGAADRWAAAVGVPVAPAAPVALEGPIPDDVTLIGDRVGTHGFVCRRGECATCGGDKRAPWTEILVCEDREGVRRAAVRHIETMHAERGPWGVFEEGLCIAAVDAKATADMLAAEAVAADDGASEVVVRALCAEHIDAEQPRDTCEECAADGAEDDDQDAEPGVDVEALGMSPMVRALVADIDAGPWHYQTRKGAHTKGLTTDIKATALTAFGERVRAALLAE
jgi:hypothetical protein